MLWCTTLPSPPHLRVSRGPFRADPDVVINSRLQLAERPLAACEIPTRERQLFRSVQMLEKRSRTAKYCKILQKNRTVEGGLKRGEAGRMSFCDLLIGSATRDLAPSRQSVAVDGRNCNEQLPSLFTRSAARRPLLRRRDGRPWCDERSCMSSVMCRHDCDDFVAGIR